MRSETSGAPWLPLQTRVCAQHFSCVEKIKNKLKDVNFKGNNLAARKLAEHEAKVIHGKYPKTLTDQFDSQTTYIDSVYVDVDADGNMILNNIGANVGYRPNKIYFNIADGAFYKLEADKKTFTVVDINDFAD